MPRSSLEKFRRRMALTAYFRDFFGFNQPLESDAVSQYYKELEESKEGYDTEGRSHVFKFLKWKVKDLITTEDLRRYDKNIRRHLEDINRQRENQIVFKPFQMLAVFTVEVYLDWLSHRSEELLARLNEFVSTWNEEEAGRIKFPYFDKSDLNKIALWMATGSGKTLLMHLNYYQYLRYAEEGSLQQPDNILLVTTNEGLSKQHIGELRESGIPCRRFNAETVSLQGVGSNPVKVIEIHKLKKEKEGEGLSVGVDTLEGKNLVFVDEGHTGVSSSTQSWRKRRRSIAENGFTFEYSATFGQAVAGSDTSIEEEYGKSILVDYSYPRFYDDGYGKDYQIVNLESDIRNELREQYLLANLLAFYEQVFVFNENKEIIRDEFNIFTPLLVFIGHTVTASKTKSNLNTNDQQSLSDVEDLLLFLNRVLKNEDQWVLKAVDKLLSRDSSIMDRNIFTDTFSSFREKNMSGKEIFDDMLTKIFNVESSSNLEVVNIENAQGEIGLRATAADKYFGLINIGNDRVFLERIENHDILKGQDSILDTLFHTINDRNSEINILLGSRKFIEGWDSWRVSTMGLMNFGRGEGPQVIQLFGRGIRLLGKGRTLKRSSELKGHSPRNISKLETLNIFGVRAEYMANFREYLKEEGIDTSSKQQVKINTKTRDDFQDKGLVTVRKKDIEKTFSNSEHIELKANTGVEPEIVLGKIGAISSERGGDIVETEQGTTYIPQEAMLLLDWQMIYSKIWNFRQENNMTNLITEKSVLKEIINERLYELYCPDEFMEVNGPNDLERLTEIAIMILRAYIENFYNQRKRHWEEKQLAYKSIEEEVEAGNVLCQYEATISMEAVGYLEKLTDKLEDEDLYSGEEGIPSRIYVDDHLYFPLLLQESEQYGDNVVFSPPGLNEGEEALIKKIRSFFNTSMGKSFAEDYDVFLLRNQSRGTGVGFLAGEEGNDKFYPDFIMWMKNETKQHIVFLEPHSVWMEGEPLENHRVKFHEKIKAYEEKLSENTEQDIRLHSYVIAKKSFSEMKNLSRGDQEEDFHQAGLYFQADGIKPIIKEIT